VTDKSKKSEKPQKDYVLIGDKISDNAQQALLFKPEDRTVEIGIIQKPVEGRPLDGDLVQLSERDGPGYDIDYVYKHPRRVPTGRPAKVNSKKYLSGWEEIWGKRDLN